MLNALDLLANFIFCSLHSNIQCNEKACFFFHERFIICVKHTVPIHTHTRIRIHYMRDTFYARMRFTSHIAQIPCVLTQNHGISISISFYSELFFSCLFIVTLAAIIIWNLFGCNAIPLCSEGWTRDEGRKRRKSQCNRVNAKLINCEIFRIVMDWIWIFWCIYTCAQF